ncbi:DUF3352 domain-containing protein [Phytoactinopolyspora alkaliphila]|uniref:DUF3352 domain-containing protein n=1 Tax=Phytoactinopolyspora alkaliphila TaxID=1783498 RepID=A0A6N9YJY0_9ACTN|nr:DUF3352 domain-containing protein [Phytoactinopolyspora alkaliphila]
MGEPHPQRRRGVLAAALALAVLLLVPGGVFAWRSLDGAGTQPHDVLPADAVGYFRLDLDPSASQKIEAMRFLRKFPAIGDALGGVADDEDLRKRVIDEFTAATGCDIDFEADVEPWLGDRLGGAMLPPTGEGTDPEFAVALQIEDQDAAEATIQQGLACGDPGADEFGRVYSDGYLILSDTQENAERHAAWAQESSLSSNSEFTEAMKLLGDQGVASMWFSSAGMFDAFEMPGAEMHPSDAFYDPDMPSMDDMRAMFEGAYRSVAMAFRFDSDYAEIASVITGDAYTELSGGGVRADVPEDTTLLLGFANGDSYLRENWETLFEATPDQSRMIQGLAATAGLTFPDDLGTLFGENFVLTLDAQNVDIDAITTYGDMSSVGLGALVDTDADAAREVWEKLRRWAEWAEMPMDDLPLELTDDGYLIASSPEAGARLIEGGGLGDTDVYTTAVKDAANADAVFFVNVDTVEDLVTSFFDEPGNEDLVASLQAVQAIGYSAHIRDGHTEVTMRITAN